MHIKIPCLSGYNFIRQKTKRQSFLLLIALLVSACGLHESSTLSLSQADSLVMTKDQRIALSATKVLENGGNAADAMSTMLLTSAVVMPSRSGLGAGGICQILNPKTGRVETLDFLSAPMSFDKKIGTPSLVRGSFVLQSKYGTGVWKESFADAINLAEQGASVSAELAQDILRTQGLTSKWKTIKTNDVLKQPELAQTLRTLAQQENVEILYSGQMASSIVSQSDQIIQEDLKATKADISDSIDVASNTNKTFFPNPTALSSADGYMIWNNLQNQKNAQKNEQAQKQLSELQDHLIDTEHTGVSFLTADDSGLVVACSVSMGQTFGSRQMTKEGFYLSTPIHPKNKVYTIFNVIQTNPDVTDVTYALQTVGNDALSDGLNLMAEKQTQTDTHSQDSITADVLELSCEKGFPNYANTCVKSENLFHISRKQNLTK